MLRERVVDSARYVETTPIWSFVSVRNSRVPYSCSLEIMGACEALMEVREIDLGYKANKTQEYFMLIFRKLIIEKPQIFPAMPLSN